MINEKQKEQILQVLSQKNYKLHYLFPYEYFLDSKDIFTEFNCERQEGKAEYLPPIHRLKELDQGCQVFVELYGMEEDEEDPWIYSESLIIFSSLTLKEVENCFAVLKIGDYLYPSEIGRDEGSVEDMVIVEEAFSAFKFSPVTAKPENIYYCWWD